MNKAGKSLWLIDLMKVVSAQLIVLHHMVAYGPLAATVKQLSPGLVAFLYQDARMAVQVFLVVAGFLAAQSIAPSPTQFRHFADGRSVAHAILLRYRRLAPHYLLALCLAILCAYFARLLIEDTDTPARPTLLQVVAHLFLLQDLLALPALSAGVWYVAIDLQLFALWVLTVYGGAKVARKFSLPAPKVLVGLTTFGVAASLYGFNLSRQWDTVAPYFFGSYGMGILAYWARHANGAWLWRAAITLMVLGSLVFEFRERIALAAVTSGILVLWADRPSPLATDWTSRLRVLSNHSYALFLVHYPIALAVGALIAYFWPQQAPIHLAGLALAWTISMGLAAGLEPTSRWLSARLRQSVKT